MNRLAPMFSFAALLAIRVFAADGAACQAAVVFRSGSEIYDQAVAGLRESLAAAPCRIHFVDLADPHAQLAPEISSNPRFVAALGLNAFDRLSDLASPPPLIPALVLRADLKPNARRASAVFADVPLPLLADRLHATFPGKSRLGMIHHPDQPAPDAALLARLRQNGFELHVVECAGPSKLLEAFASLKGKVDLLIAQPDAELFNSATLKPLIMASLENRLPIVGFSAAFVRAGALAGVYPDFHDLGKQTGDLLLRLLSGHPAPEEDARKVVIAVNPRIARLIGIEPRLAEGTGILK